MFQVAVYAIMSESRVYLPTVPKSNLNVFDKVPLNNEITSEGANNTSSASL